MQRCEILHPSLGEKIQLLRDWIASLEASKTIPQLEVAVDDSKTALIIRHLEALSEDDQLKIKNFAQAHHYWIYLQPKGPDSIKLFYPEGDEKQLAYALPQYKIEIKFNPEDFTQVNGSLNPKMIELALFLLDIQPEDKVLDLFCGLGNFTLPIARFAKSVIGVEGDESMTQRAALNATNNGISNVAFYAANLFEINENAAFMQQFDKILLDPPRAGAEEIVKNIKNFNAKRIVYVSCNPSTLARDAGILVHEAGYTLEKAGVMDMFPHTTHVESIALFTK
jgi:23S rRNA (uracil1939-C5)-methyltransferase